MDSVWNFIISMFLSLVNVYLSKYDGKQVRNVKYKQAMRYNKVSMSCNI